MASSRSINSTHGLHKDTACLLSPRSWFLAGLGVLTSNDGRVAGVILGNVLLDLSNQISAHISSLGVNAATHTTEERDGGASQSVSSDGLIDALPVLTVDLRALLAFSLLVTAVMFSTCEGFRGKGAGKLYHWRRNFGIFGL